MKKPDIPVHEPTRMAALCGLAILDTPAEERFDRVTRIAQRHFQVPIALVSLVDAERQWFKSRQGLGASETPRDISFCGHAILSEDILYIPNALDDARFADNPLVTGAPNIRFYAGAPLHAPGGERVGTLCIIDDKPRTFSAEELTVLRDLAGCVELELERTRITEAAHEAHRFQQILDKARDMIFMFDAKTLQFVYLNQGAVQSMGYTREALLQLHPYDIKPHFPEATFCQLIAPLLSGEREVLLFETVHRRKDGVDFPVEIFLQLEREAEGAGRFVAIVRDISERKRIESDLRSSENRIRAIIDTVVDGIISIDSKGNIQTVNPAAERLFGYKHEDMLGRNVNFLMPEPFHSAHDGYLHNYLVSGNKKIIGIGREVTGLRADGGTFPMELAVSEMEVNGERMFTGIVRDITARKNLEEVAKQNAERLGLATRSSGIGIWDWDIPRNVLIWDERMFELYGVKQDEFAGAYQAWLAGVHPDDRARCEQAINQALKGEAPYDIEFRVRWPDGTSRDIKATGHVIRDAQGKPLRMAGINYDITERNRDESRIKNAENRLRAIINTVVDGIVTIDAQGFVHTFNLAAERIFGLTAEQIVGRKVNNLMPEPFRREHDDYLHNYLTTGKRKIIGIGREVVGRRPDGSTFPMELAVSEMEVNGERMFTGVVRDISARKQAEAELRAVTAMRQAILDSANFSFIATDTEGVISVFNQGAQRMLGYTADEMVGKQTPAILHLPSEVVARAKALSAELGESIAPGFEAFVAKTRDGHADENEWTYVRKDGSTFPVLLSVTALFDDAGKVYGYLGIGSDITERKRVDKMKREFISTVSHELRTPLTSIRGALGLVAGGATGTIPDKARELVSIASNNCDRLVRLINDILDMEKIESGKMTFDMQPVDLRILFEEAIAANQAYAAQHRVKIAVEGELPLAEVIGDRDRLIQVLTNLLSNAAKFTAPGGTVHVSLAEAPGAVLLRVRDEGPGIPEEFQSRIFQKFSQADSSDTRSKGGSGLGLSITQAIVEHHGGQIGFETVAGRGATFWVRLPAQPAAEAGEPRPGQARVLVVEDDRDVAKLLRLILEQEGYAVDVAYSIAQARERLESGRYAAMTLDLLLPGESGMAFVRELRERPESVTLPIVVVSAVVERGRKELNGAAVSVLDWLGKPIDEQRLLKAVAEAVKVSGGKRRVLHVEDDADIAHVLSTMLEGVVELDLAPTLKQAHAYLDSNDYALVILDIGLPDGSGLDLLPRLAQIKPPIPILVFSAQELNAHDSRQVSAAFVKSRTDIDRLVHAIRTHVAARDKDLVK